MTELTVPEPHAFNYVRIPDDGKCYFCLQQNILLLAWLLFLKKTSLTPVQRPDSQVSFPRRLRHRMRVLGTMVRSHVKVLAILGRYQREGWKREGVLELPCFGQICLPVYQGYKVFDFYRKRVVKVFDREVKPSIIQGEIDVLKEVSDLGFATSITTWNIAERWYAEEYASGTLDSSYTPLDSGRLKHKFSRDLVYYLTRLILVRKPKVRHSIDYVLEMSGKLHSKDASHQTTALTEVPGLASFIEGTVDRLRMKGNQPIFLVFAHGDFVPANMLNTSQGIRIIDWEGAGYWSVLYDFYSYFFYRVTSRDVPVGTLVREIQEALPLFLAKLTRVDQEMAWSVKSMESLYRHIFYMEMIYRLIKRSISDKNLNIMNRIRRYLGAFTRYEEMLTGYSAMGSQPANCTLQP